jgi:hypothetical protein
MPDGREDPGTVARRDRGREARSGGADRGGDLQRAVVAPGDLGRVRGRPVSREEDRDRHQRQQEQREARSHSSGHRHDGAGG